MTTNHVEIIEVGPRDGLQREKTIVSTEDKIRLINKLVEAGIRQIQVTSFVHPKYVPQMADAEAVCAGIQRQSGVIYSGLVLNMKGLERAMAADLTHVDVSISASDSHSRQNAGRGLEDALADQEKIIEKAHAVGLHVRAGIQCAFGYQEPDVTQDGVVELARQHLAWGVDALSLADTTGMANPRQIKAMLAEIMPLAGEVPVILHLHDTQGMGLANVSAALEAGCRHFDTAFGGMGGCNFIPNALGNIPTEDTVNMLHALGYESGVDMAVVAQASRMLQRILGTPLPGKLYWQLAPTS